MTDTLLVLAGLGVPLYSARGLTQSLDPIAQASQVLRMINGDLADFAAPQFRKYKSTISATDQRPPSVDGKWPGQIVTVDCVAELTYLTAGGSPGRTVVAGSSYVEGDYTHYRPQLVMRVIDYTSQRDEWDRSINWQMNLEEI